MAYPVSSQLPAYQAKDPDRGAAVKIVALMLGIALPAVLGFALWSAASANKARDDARAAAAQVSATSAMPGVTTGTASGATATGAVATPSFAGLAPANADAIAAAHRAYPAELPALQAGPVVNVNLGIAHRTIEVAPGIKYEAWTFGAGVPGPVVHVRQGQTVRITLTNNAPMPHSVDFHAARIAPNVAFADVAPGKSFTFSFKADDPGVFMYHCGTKPVLAHIANGMYGAIVVEPKAGLLPKPDHEYVLVSGEWYLNGPGLDKPAQLDMVKADQMKPDWVTWNGYAGQYVKHPLTAMPGETVRFWVVDAGPEPEQRLPRRRHASQPRLGQRRPDERAATRDPDGGRPGRRRRRLRRHHRQAGSLPLRLALVRNRSDGTGRPARGRRGRGDDEPLDPVATGAERAAPSRRGSLRFNPFFGRANS